MIISYYFFIMLVNFTRLQAIVLQHHDTLSAEPPSAKRQHQAWRRLQASTMHEDQMRKVMTNDDEWWAFLPTNYSHIIQDVSDNIPRNSFGKQIRQRPNVVALCRIYAGNLWNCRHSPKTQDEELQMYDETKGGRSPLKITPELPRGNIRRNFLPGKVHFPGRQT